MSGTGKSTVVAELAARGYQSIDCDTDEWSEWAPAGDGSGVRGDLDWVWRADRVEELLSAEAASVLFLGGCASNQVQFHSRFDAIVLLSAPAALMAERLATRSTNLYGRQPAEAARALQLKQTVEPRLRRVADLEIDTSVPLDQVVAEVLRLAR
jgi:shikimate kinase